MRTVNFRIAIISDGRWLEGVKTAATKNNLTFANISLCPDIWDGTRQFSIHDFDNNPILKGMLCQQSTIFRNMIFSLQLIQPGTPKNVEFTVNLLRPDRSQQVNSYSDSVTVQCQAPEAQDKTGAIYASFLATLKSELVALDLPPALTAGVRDVANAYHERSEAEIAALKSLGLTLNQSLVERQGMLEKFFIDKQQALESKAEAQREALEAEHRRQLDAVKAREDALTARLSQVNDKDSKYERRRLHKEIQDLITAREHVFKLTDGTCRLRKPIRIACIFIIGFAMATLTFYAYEMFKASSPTAGGFSEWFLAAKMLGATLLLGSTAVFYIRWENQWFRRHADEEFLLKRFALDIGRASWLVEMCLEWKKETQDVIPPQLLDQLSRNLFMESEKRKDPPLHPADQLASALLGTAAKVDLKLPGGELHLDRKDVSKLRTAQIDPE